MAMTEDQEITCADCGNAFVFTAQEQEFFAEKGFSAPKRCRTCRANRKAQGGGGGGRGGGGYGGGGGGGYGGGGGGGSRGGYGGGGGGGGRGGRDRGPREMHDAICATCGKPTQVPFKPTGDRPVYCRDCFRR